MATYQHLLPGMGATASHRSHRLGARPDPASYLSPARSLSTARGSISPERSDQLHCSQSGSGHRQIRLAHTTTVATPAIGRSRTLTRRRP